jgi:uncharacterized membrane protein YphA (DoxX/SURF4 family)
MTSSIPTEQRVINFCLNASLLKLLAGVAIVLMLFTGYVAVQLATFIQVATLLHQLKERKIKI